MQGGSDGPAPDGVEKLVANAQDGDAASFAGLYEQFYGNIFRYLVFKIGNVADAEDLTEEVFLRMLQAIRSFKWQGRPFSSWLYRIAHNLVVDYFRKKARQKTLSLEEIDVAGTVGASSHDVDAHLDIQLSVGEVHRAMGGLTKLQQEVISLRFVAGLSVLETAQAMDKKENAVKALQHAAIKKLRASLVTRPEESRGRTVPLWSP
jgi:RNA polymerase sigma-70 factor (ECF subfamily)